MIFGVQRDQRDSHCLGEDGGLIVSVGHADPHGGGACPGGAALVHGHHHKLVDVVGPLVVQVLPGADDALRRDVKVQALDEVGDLRVQACVAVSG